jgi:TolA-binding protein
MSRILAPLSLAALAVLTAGCAAPLGGSGGGTDPAEIRDQLFKLQQDTAKILDRIESLEERKAEGEPGESTAQESCARAATRVASLEEQIQQLQTLLAEDRSRIEDLAQMLRSLRAGTDIPSWSSPDRLAEVMKPREGDADNDASGDVGGDGTAETEGDGTAQQGGQGSGQTPQASPEDLFNSAYTDYSRGNFELALAGFEAALRADPLGPRADDAQHWIGETLFEMERYQDAVDAFDRVVETYPDSAIVLRSRLKKGLALFEARRTAEAVEVLQKLISEHPDSDEARIAEEYLKRRGIEFE